MTHTLNAAVEQANAVALERILSADPVWEELAPAHSLIPALEHGVLLHSGPPITWNEMPGCTRGAVAAALLYEGWARTIAEAEQMAERGAIRFIPGHEVNCVAPVAGIVSPSMPLLAVTDRAHGTRAYSPLNEGRGRVIRYGACDPEAIERLHWFDRHLVPLLQTVLKRTGGVPLSEHMGEALHMGDELHNRNKAFTRNVLLTVALELISAGVAGNDVTEALNFIAKTDVFFLNLSMASSKAALSAIEGIPWCSLVSVMCQNGHRFGVRIAGLPGRWFAVDAPMVQGRFFEHWTAEDACPAIGDSVITETAGLGAFSLAAAPALVRYIGGTPQAAIELNERMYQITVGENPRFTIPALGFRGAPTGIDVRKVIATGQAPVTNAGIAHRDPGVGQIGAGYIDTPLQVFELAWRELRETWEQQADQNPAR